MEKVCDPEEEYYFLRPKPQTECIPKSASPLIPQSESEPKDNIKAIIKTKPTTEANPLNKPKDKIYSKIKIRCEEFNEEFKNKIALTTHSYSHNCKYLEKKQNTLIKTLARK